MFTLATIQDLIRLEPESFGENHTQILSQEINRKYSNRVLSEVGLCVSLYDILSNKDGTTKDGDGSLFIDCCFRLTVFQPFQGEILVGWISSCTPDGINVRMDFFDDIFLPAHNLFSGAQFIASEQAWVWNVNDMDLYLDTNEKLRFRAEQLEFNKEGMKLVGSCSEEGLGLISWWQG